VWGTGGWGELNQCKIGVAGGWSVRVYGLVVGTLPGVSDKV